MIIESQAKNAELLPNYETATRGSRQPPQVPQIYTFTNWQHGSMLVMPPRDATSQQPLYRITVDLDLNPFLPVSYNTRIMRCGRREGEVVGEFAFALNNKRAVLRIGDLTTRLSNALYSVNSSPRHFNWILENRLHWDCRSSLPDGSPLCICYLPSPQTSPDPRAPPQPPPASQSRLHLSRRRQSDAIASAARCDADSVPWRFRD
ncbi:hypothetical protein NLJ89_g10177 [Agrocybe chaxingu]|uniref:Uncharacterized protein n=1 Tax=Agrocybe chaxingu TaxID=84603 RepID=A0A9W8MSW0_9AGAR|nr:hypothetical protein NLJ89_g10177 [Agrocybe chaxingu]